MDDVIAAHREVLARIKDRATIRALKSGEARVLVVDPNGDRWPSAENWPLSRRKKDGSDKLN
jgi:hypothetical protein